MSTRFAMWFWCNVYAAVPKCTVKKTDLEANGLHRGGGTNQCPDEDSFELNAVGDGTACELACKDGYYRSHTDEAPQVSCTTNGTALSGATVYDTCDRTWYMSAK